MQDQTHTDEPRPPHSAPGMGEGEATPAQPSEDQSAEPGSDNEEGETA